MTAPGELSTAGEGVSSPEDRAQLEWEARAGRQAAAAAFAAALLPLIGTIATASAIGSTDGDAAQFLEGVDGSSAGVLLGSVVTAIGTLVLPLALGYLYRATRARRPETPSFVLPLLVGACVGLAGVLVIQQLFVIDVAGDFTTGADQSEDQAETLLDESGVQATGFVDAGMRVALGAAVILISLNAMRAGLLGRFMGIVGIGVGVFYAVPILVEPTLIQLFWGIALGLLFLGRWPGGERGPAWDRVEAIPWPSTAQRLEAQRRGQEQADGQAGAAQDEGEAAPEPRPASRKRRRGR